MTFKLDISRDEWEIVNTIDLKLPNNVTNIIIFFDEALKYLQWKVLEYLWADKQVDSIWIFF